MYGVTSLLQVDMNKPIVFTAIGYVENEFDEPTLPQTIRAAESRIILKRDLTDGLLGLAPGQRLLVLFYFHRSKGFELLQHPQGNKSRPCQGVFCLRSPRRPNPIGASVVDLLEITENVLRVRGLDALNGTPILDLKLERG